MPHKLLRYGGFIAGLVLIAFGIGAIYMGVDGRSTVQSSLALEKITGSEDMNPTAIKAEAKEAGLPASLALPTCNIANKPIEDGTSARCFASYIRIHALESSGGLTYSELPRFATEDGKGTSDAKAALLTAEGEPVANPVRETWINATALSTALNVSYMAQQLALFGIVVGIALLLSGIGFIVLAAGLLGTGLARQVEAESRSAPIRSSAPIGA
jgi:hypothetical protein